METYRLVRPEHLNHYGYLFGGNLLKWIDEYAYIAANLDFPGRRFVTVSLDDVVFKKSIVTGSVLRFMINNTKIGTTSVRYTVKVYADKIESGKESLVFETNVTFVNVDEQGNKQPVRKEGMYA